MRASSHDDRPAAGREVPRRRLFEMGISAVLALGGSMLAFARAGGYAVPDGQKLLALTPWQFVVVQHAARRIAAPDGPGAASAPTADELGVAAFVDAWAQKLPTRTRRDLGRFLLFIEHVAPLTVGRLRRFTRLRPEDQDRVFASLQSSSIDLLRAGFDGLRSLVFLGYYRDPRAWKIIGYDGPLVGRPAAGW